MGEIETENGGRMKIAILLHGLVHRSLRHTVESLQRCVIEPFFRVGSVEIFFHSWNVASVHNPRGGEYGIGVDSSEVARLLPEARGVFESQEKFDGTVDWERLFARNPMRHCCGSEEEARATLMNFRRALESQERAWRFFEESRTRSYDVVVATRGDLRFLEEGRWDTLVPRLKTGGQECPPSLWVPRFHSWGGVNDRFAMGNEEAIRIWSNRTAFADGWLLKAERESSEWLLKQWLERNRVRVEFLDFVFQRVRANGEVAAMDREIKGTSNVEHLTSNIEVAENGGRQDACSTERFLILAREAGVAAESLRKVLEPLGKVEVIVDRVGEAGDAPATVFIPDEEAEGFDGLMGRTADFPRITAWSRAMVHLSRTSVDDEAVWFVEDDVAGAAEAFAGIVKQTRGADADLAARDIQKRTENPGWYFWGRGEGFFDEPCRAFQPLCRVSGRLLREVLAFRERHGRFIFHEVLFASLAREKGMRVVDWNRKPDYRKWFSVFRFRPEVRPVERGISHPVKDARVHEAVCIFSNVAACERAAIYEGEKKGGWYVEDFGRWKRMFVTEQAVRVLETGVSSGVSANLLLDEVFLNPLSEVHGIDLFDGDGGELVRADFAANAARGGHEEQLHLYEGTTREVLAWMIAGDGYWEGFDFIHLNGPENAEELLADACQAWSLLKPGGVLVFGGGEWKRSAVEAFRSVFRESSGSIVRRSADGRDEMIGFTKGDSLQPSLYPQKAN